MSDLENSLTSNRPYLLRAIYDWLLDNQLTPQILVDATQVGVEVPKQYVKDGQILLNMGVSAVNNLLMDNTAVSFSARFSGQSMLIYVPVSAVLAIFSRENGQGMAFPNETDTELEQIGETTEKPNVSIEIKSSISLSEINSNAAENSSKENGLVALSENNSDDATDKNQTSKTNSSGKPKKSKPTLKIVK